MKYTCSSRTKKIAIAGFVGVAVILVIPLFSGEAERNNDASESKVGDVVSDVDADTDVDGGVENKPGLSEDILASCKCFTMEDLDRAMSDIIGNDEYTFHEDVSCTGETTTAISYSSSQHSHALGYSVGEGYCRELDAMRRIDPAEETVCRALIDAKCSEIDGALDLAYIPVFTCPCFDEERLDIAFGHITGDGGYIFDADNSCTGGAETGVQYSFLENGQYPVAMGYGVAEGTCQEGDALQIIDVGQEVACKSLIESKCAEYKDDI